MAEEPQYPDTLEGWMERIVQIPEEYPEKVFADAYAGKAQAVASVKAVALEIQAAAAWIASNAAMIQASEEIMVEVANQIIDTMQALLLILAILLLLKRFKKKRRQDVEDVVVTEAQYRKDLDGKLKARSRAKTEDKAKDILAIKLRFDWLIHYIYTVLKSMEISSGVVTDEDREREEGEDDVAKSVRVAKKKGGELVWVSKKDKDVCTVCRYMDGKKSVDGNFLPVILKAFPAYKPYTNWMGWPHAHPRCRCEAKPA